MKSDKRKEIIRPLPFFFSGRFFLLFGMASALILPVYFYFPSGLLIPVAVDAILLSAALIDFFRCPGSDRITVARTIPRPLAVDRANEVLLDVSNLSGSPVLMRIRDDTPQQSTTRNALITAVIGPGSGTRLTYPLTPLKRGRAEFGNIHFWTLGPLGLAWKRGESQAAGIVKFYPALALIERQRMQVRWSSSQDVVRPLKKRGEGSDFDNLREYVPGDDPRLVNWAATARRGRPIVRQNRIERSQNIFLVLDVGRMMTARVMGRTKLDFSIEAGLLLAYAALEVGDKVGITTVGQEVLNFLAPSKAPDQFGRILESVYALQPRLEEPRYYLVLSDLSTKLRRRSLMVIFTDLIDERASEGLIRYSLALLPRHLPLVVAMSDTELAHIAGATPEEKSDLYRKAVASELLERRERLLARLRTAGVLVLDTPPDKISTAVLDRYLEIKGRNVL
jgi:uncharacterized protein (DUF58 family)